MQIVCQHGEAQSGSVERNGAATRSRVQDCHFFRACLSAARCKEAPILGGRDMAERAGLRVRLALETLTAATGCVDSASRRARFPVDAEAGPEPPSMRGGSSDARRVVNKGVRRFNCRWWL